MKRAATEDAVELGEFEARRVTAVELFFELCDELERDVAADDWPMLRLELGVAWRQARLYLLNVRETDSMFRSADRRTDAGVWRFFMRQPGRDSLYYLPCCAILSATRADTIQSLWTAPRARCRGYATALLNLLSVRYATRRLEDVPFYEQREITCVAATKEDAERGRDESEEKLWSRHGESVESVELDSMSEEDSQAEDDELRTLAWRFSLPLGAAALALRSSGLIPEICEQILRLVAMLFREDAECVVFRPIESFLWSGVYGTMTAERGAKQEFKCNIRQRNNICDHPRYFGQCSRDSTSVPHNKTLAVYRSYVIDPGSLAIFADACVERGIRVHTEAMWLGGCTLVILMDSAVSQPRAVSFVRAQLHQLYPQRR